MSEEYRTESARNNHVRILSICDQNVCPIPAVVRGNPDRLSHVVSFMRSFIGDAMYQSGMNEDEVAALRDEWDTTWAENPTTLRAALSAAAVCSVCTYDCDYRYLRGDGTVVEEGILQKLAL